MFGICLAAALGGMAMASPLAGRYGGDGARLDVRADGLRLDLACAQATIGTPQVDARGNFTATGSYQTAHGGPDRVDESGRGNPARFVGRLAGDRLTLEIIPATGEPVTLHLDRNRTVKMVRCL